MIILNADILWLIFWQSATDEQTERSARLCVARACSQVSHLWRTILVDSPLIWSRLLVISQEFHPEWINEVLRRSGSLPLWVDILLSYYEQTERLKRLLFITFNVVLRDNWKRLHTLDMSLLGAFHRVLTIHDWTPFFQPAPLLRSCTVTTALPRNLGSPKYPPLFSNHAPFLRTFRSNFLAIPQAAAARQMRDLTVHEGNVSGVLRSLSSMPYLEMLVIHSLNGIRGSPPFHEVVQLHYLNHLVTFTPKSELIDLLDGLSLPCRTLRTVNCTVEIKNHDLGPLMDILRECIERLFKSHEQSGVPVSELSHLCLSLGPNGFRLVLGPSFTINALTTYTLDKNAVMNLVNAFRLRKFDQVTFLILRVDNPLHYYTSLTSLLTSMYSVNTLEVPDTFFPIANLEADQPRGRNFDNEIVLFPQLHTLCVVQIILFKDEPQGPLVYALHRFLARRISQGYPVSNLFLRTKPAFVAKLRDIFYDIVGLRIVWNDTTASGELVGHNLFCKGAMVPLQQAS
ncbi:hypothetical protein CPC08DRAFT_495725 [Agrocybe pediades]|nr:hypothetical protein CPC08DRAFT_495725 [Agrocybe pediades]